MKRTGDQMTRDACEAAVKTHGGIQPAARALGVPYTTLRRWLGKYEGVEKRPAPVHAAAKRKPGSAKRTDVDEFLRVDKLDPVQALRDELATLRPGEIVRDPDMRQALDVSNDTWRMVVAMPEFAAWQVRVRRNNARVWCERTTRAKLLSKPGITEV